MKNVKPNENVFETMGNGSIFDSGVVEDEQTTPLTEEEPNSGASTFEATLSPAEKDIYNAMTANEHQQLQNMALSIQLNDDSFIGSYGTNAMSKVEQASKEALNLTRVRDLGEAGTLMNGLIMNLKKATPQKKQGAFFRVKSYLEQININYTKSGNAIEKAKTALENHQNQLQQDNIQYEKMYTQVLDNYRLLTMYIISGKIKLDEARKELVALQTKAAQTGNQGDIEAAGAYEDNIRNFDNLLNELEGSKVLCMQTAPAIRVAKQNNVAIIQKFNVLRFTAIPAWYTQIQLMINQENTKNAINAAEVATDFTNALIMENAKVLNQNTVMAAQLSESEVIKTDTLEAAQQLLIQTWDEVTEIHKEGQRARNESRNRKIMLEEDFKQELIKRMNPNP